MSIFSWIVVFVSAIVAYLAVAKQMKFSLLTSADGTSRFSAVKGLLPSSSSEGDGKPSLISKWWNGLDSEASPGQRFVLLVGALLLAYGELRWRGSVWAALILLLIAAVIKPPKSKITHAFVYLDLGLVILAGFFPGFASMRNSAADITNAWSSNKAAAMAQYAETYKKDLAAASAPAAAGPELTPAEKNAKRLRETPDVLPVDVVVPVGLAVVSTPPAGYRLSSMECPATNVINISDPSTGVIYRQIDCAGSITLGANDLHNKQFVFFLKPGVPVPSKVTVWWKKA